MARRRGPFDRPGPDDYADLANSSINAFLRLRRPAQLAIVALCIIVGIVGLVIYFHGQTWSSRNQAAGNPNLLLGNPSRATDSPANFDNYLMVKPYFVLSYNSTKGTPNWVSWRVTADDLGHAPRKQVFDEDNSLPPGLSVVNTRDYSGSGFDRGHMCPHDDRAANEQMSFATFVMTNIIPQAPNVNQKAWAQLESYCRELVRLGDRLYIISGPAGQGGRGSRGFKQTIGHGKVTVPAECWKIVVVVESNAGSDDLAAISMGTRVIAVDMPNDQDVVGEEWDQYRTSPAQIEQKTGLHFFDRVRPDVAAALRQRVDDVSIPPPRPMRYERNEGPDHGG